jgi:hypothetical protein
METENTPLLLRDLRETELLSAVFTQIFLLSTGVVSVSISPGFFYIGQSAFFARSVLRTEFPVY